MSEKRKIRLVGYVVIGTVVVVCGILTFVLGSLLFLHLEGTYFLMPDESDEVVVLRLQSQATTMMGEQFAAEYLLRFSSGEEAVVSFRPDSAIAVGDRLRIRYARTRVLRQVLVREVERIRSLSP